MPGIVKTCIFGEVRGIDNEFIAVKNGKVLPAGVDIHHVLPGLETCELCPVKADGHNSSHAAAAVAREIEGDKIISVQRVAAKIGF